MYDDYNQRFCTNQDVIGTLTTNSGSSAKRTGFKICESQSCKLYGDLSGNTEPKTIYKQRVRKLMPKECWRLMGFDDQSFEKAQNVNSNTQLYKQAGNSIVVDVLMAIFKEML